MKINVRRRRGKEVAGRPAHPVVGPVQYKVCIVLYVRSVRYGGAAQNCKSAVLFSGIYALS